MATLLERLRAARETVVESGGFKFTIRRPTDVQMYAWTDKDTAFVLRQCLVGWDGVKEIDVVPGGDGTPATFELTAACEWIEDQPQIFVDLIAGIRAAIDAHRGRRRGRRKKLAAAVEAANFKRIYGKAPELTLDEHAQAVHHRMELHGRRIELERVARDRRDDRGRGRRALGTGADRVP